MSLRMPKFWEIKSGAWLAGMKVEVSAEVKTEDKIPKCFFGALRMLFVHYLCDITGGEKAALGRSTRLSICSSL